MKSPGVYYNPKMNKIIEIVRKTPFLVAEVEIDLYEIFDEIRYITLNNEIFYYLCGPILGFTDNQLKGYYKIGRV